MKMVIANTIAMVLKMDLQRQCKQSFVIHLAGDDADGADAGDGDGDDNVDDDYGFATAVNDDKHE